MFDARPCLNTDQKGRSGIQAQLTQEANKGFHTDHDLPF